MPAKGPSGGMGAIPAWKRRPSRQLPLAHVDAGHRNAGKGRNHRGTAALEPRLRRKIPSRVAGHARQTSIPSRARLPPSNGRWSLAPAAFDRWVDGDEKAISESAKRGFVLFNTKAACFVCHTGWRFTDDRFHDIGYNRHRSRSRDRAQGRRLDAVCLQDADASIDRATAALHAQRIVADPVRSGEAL